jgi:hypothetical protein
MIHPLLRYSLIEYHHLEFLNQLYKRSPSQIGTRQNVCLSNIHQDIIRLVR